MKAKKPVGRVVLILVAISLTLSSGVMAAKVRKGDLNNDHKVNSFDAALLKRVILKRAKNISVNMEAADINNDHKVNSADLKLLQKRLIKTK